ncbi:MAG TPA: DUF2059 domain-containing protein [Chitinophagaceae bacterium]|jgi:hypothetical protein|nr:DUF2059 domain-containing protein [Chitinophagaceae bacterium]
MRKYTLILCLLACCTGALAQTAPARKKETRKEARTRKGSDVPPPIERLEETKIDVAEPTPAAPEAFPMPDTAAPPADALTAALRHLLRVTNSLDLGTQFAQQLTNRDQMDPQRTLPDVFFTRLMESMKTGEGRRLLEHMVIYIYREHFTLEEVNAINAFYETPAGKKLISTMPLLLPESMKRGQAIGVYLARKVYGELVSEGLIKN